MKRAMSLLLCFLTAAAAILPLSSCGKSGTPSDTAPADTQPEVNETAPEDTAPEETEAPEEKGTELIRDLKLEGGMTLLSQKDHSAGDAITVLGTHSFYQGKEAASPVWRLAQWDSGPCLIENQIDAGVGAITDGEWRSFSYDPDENVMSFLLDTSLYYQGKPAVQGDYWPHLLIEQDDFGYFSLPEEQKKAYSCASDHLILSMDVRMDVYQLTKIQGDWVRAAQFLLYFYVKGTETNDFCWFGVQLFDNRTKYTQNYVAYDGGKPDASGAMIYLIGTETTYRVDGENVCPFWNKGVPEASDDWLHIEIDLKPYLEDMLEAGKKDGYFKADSLEGLCINGMNLGWETIGTFYHEMSVKNLSLRSYTDGE